MVERFQLSIFLMIILVRNFFELTSTSSALLPATFIQILPSANTLQVVITPILVVLLSEIMVDWIKHAFITKFNHMRPTVYRKFIDVLCNDLVRPKGKQLAGVSI